MEIQDIRSKGKKELKKNLAELRNEVAKNRFDIASKQVKNHRDLRKAKKNIARILTFLKENEKKEK